MKFKFDIECTPEEARAFLGLPDVAGMQEAMMQEIEAKIRDNIQNLDPEDFIKTWMPAAAQGFGDMQKMFWGQMGASMPEPDKKKKT